MFRILLLSFFLVLTGCASTSAPPIKTGEINSIKSGKTAVMFYDDDYRIAYLEDSYRVLAITVSTTHASYKGFWDIDKDMSAFHAKNLRTYGVNAESAYKKFSKKEAKYYSAKQPAMYAALKDFYSSEPQVKKKAESKIIDEKLRKRLIQKGYSYLAWIPLGLYSLHIRTLGLNPLENVAVDYIFYDLKKKKIMWNGAFSASNTIDLKGVKGKDFLEKNNLQGYKTRLKSLTSNMYKRKNNLSIGVTLGFIHLKSN